MERASAERRGEVWQARQGKAGRAEPPMLLVKGGGDG